MNVPLWTVFVFWLLFGAASGIAGLIAFLFLMFKRGQSVEAAAAAMARANGGRG